MSEAERATPLKAVIMGMAVLLYRQAKAQRGITMETGLCVGAQGQIKYQQQDICSVKYGGLTVRHSVFGVMKYQEGTCVCLCVCVSSGDLTYKSSYAQLHIIPKKQRVMFQCGARE